jgi:hypothetical protein
MTYNAIHSMVRTPLFCPVVSASASSGVYHTFTGIGYYAFTGIILISYRKGHCRQFPVSSFVALLHAVKGRYRLLPESTPP